MFHSLEKVSSKFDTVTFDNSKNELLLYDDCKVCMRRISSRGFVIGINNGRISLDTLLKSTVFIISGAKDSFGLDEIIDLQNYVKHGGKLLIMDSCGKTSNINYLLNLYGIQFRKDTLIRTQKAKNYLHPSEALIADGVVNDSIYSLNCVSDWSEDLQRFPILYPYGCTMNVKKPSSVLFSSGSVCIPFHRPICAFYRDISCGGKIFAIGSAMMLSDSYIAKEHNIRFFDLALDLLTNDGVYLNPVDAQCPDITDYATTPFIAKLSDLPFSCLQTTGEVSPELENFHLFCDRLAEFDSRHFAKTLEAYKELRVERKCLSIIKPKFEAPLPELVPALVPPRFRDLPLPPLELMDLDDFYMSKSLRLERLTFKCDEDADLEYYIKEFGDMVNLPRDLSAKEILFYVCKELVVRKASDRFQ